MFLSKYRRNKPKSKFNVKLSSRNKYLIRLKLCFLLICSALLTNSIQGREKSLPNFKIHQRVLQYRIGDKIIKLIVSETSKRKSKFVYINLHDNENTSVEAANEMIEKYGGTLIELKNEDERLVNFSIGEKQFTFDPNRIFTKYGIKETLAKNGESSVEAEIQIGKFAANLTKILRWYRLIVALHNNTDGEYSLKSYENLDDLGRDILFFNENPNLDTDDFFYATDKRIFQFLKNKNQNVALQDNLKVTNDGSLSVYCGQKKIAYFNVESQNGHLEEQYKMLETFQKFAQNFGKVKIKNRREY